jgi:hypothetical protein
LLHNLLNLWEKITISRFNPSLVIYAVLCNA